MNNRISKNKKTRLNNSELNIKLTFYRCCFQEKHHYDNLSWVIGGILLIYVGAILYFIIQMDGSVSLLKRLIAVIFSVLLLSLWKGIYNRNRLWAEVTNQKIRDFERDPLIRTEGIGIKFMKVWDEKKIDLINKDEFGRRLNDTEDGQEEIPEWPMHKYIDKFINSLKIFIIFAFICLELIKFFDFF